MFIKCQNNRDSAWRKNSKIVWQFCIPQLSIPSDKDSNWNVKTDFALMRNVGQLTWENVLPILLKVDQCGHTDASQFERMLFSFFFKKMANPSLFFIYFRSFQTNFTIFTTNKCEKCPSSIWHRVSNTRPLDRECLPITTRPGLPPKAFLLC